MWKKSLLAGLPAGAVPRMLLAGGMVLMLSGCTIKLPFGPGGGGSVGSVYKSTDAGETFEPKTYIDEKAKLSADILSAALHPTNSQILYVGTDGAGIFRTVNGGEEWQRLDFPPTKNYGLAVDQLNGDRIFASGVYNETGKIYRTENAGSDWKEVYTEPGPGTVISALALDPRDPRVVYVGTSAGVIIKSTDGGETWKNVAVAGAPVSQIHLNQNAPDTVVLLVFNKGTMVSRDGGTSFTDHSKPTYEYEASATDPNAPATSRVKPENMFTLASDPSRAGVFYAGAQNGLFRTDDFGATWNPLPIIESSKKFPIRSVAVHPTNGNELVYASGSAFYKSIDGGQRWSTAELSINRGVSRILYDYQKPSELYFTLRGF